jgi:hypothetical protein
VSKKEIKQDASVNQYFAQTRTFRGVLKSTDFKKFYLSEKNSYFKNSQAYAFVLSDGKLYQREKCLGLLLWNV